MRLDVVVVIDMNDGDSTSEALGFWCSRPIEMQQIQQPGLGVQLTMGQPVCTSYISVLRKSVLFT